MRVDAECCVLDQRCDFPEGLRSVASRNIKQVLARPTLMHLAGQSSSTLFVSAMLHGDEDVGLKAVQRVMSNHRYAPLPRCLSIFIGNVDAAEKGQRYLSHQPDYNRVWPGSELAETATHVVMRQVVEAMVERRVAASIDLHNNSGRNPHYACICSLNVEHLRLAALFSHRVLYFQRPKGVQTQAFAQFCPSITCECGPIGDASGVCAAADLLERALHTDTISNAPYVDRCDNNGSGESKQSVLLYHTIATWRIASGATVSFDDHSGADVQLRADLDLLNFQELRPGECLAQVGEGGLANIEVRDEGGRLVTEEFFRMDGNRLCLRQAVLPSMFTCSTSAIRQDCVGYFTEHFPLSKLRSSEMPG